MRNSTLAILLIVPTVSWSSPCLAQDKIPDGYHLVWADEFEANGKPDPKNWVFEEGFRRNQELQWYQSENASCKDGKLIIEGRREQKPNPTYSKGSKKWGEARKTIEYTSACLMTKGLHSWQFGRFEIKAKIKTEQGLWPAIWTLGIDGKWPSNGEVDILEHYQGMILANACWGSPKPKWNSSKKPLKSFGDPNWDQKFHVWRMDWDSKTVKLFVDDSLLNTIDLTKTINPDGQEPKNPFHQPHYLLLNLAIGGQAGGDPSKTAFPNQYEIDYVRVYQKKDATQ